jgi:orotidine-5'-phosphate decarboxylase
MEVVRIKKACGEAFGCLTPGIRPAEAGGAQATDDQRRIVTPADAVAAGSDYLVVGRPVTRAADPLGAVRELARQMRAGA